MRRPPRNAREPLVGGWLFFRYMAIGIYIGVATVAGYAWWFMYYSEGPQISYYQLVSSSLDVLMKNRLTWYLQQTNFHSCSALFPQIGCEMFTNEMHKRATTVSLSILVVVEMANAMNSLSQGESLLSLPIWANMYLVGAIALSMALHFMILYVPFFSVRLLFLLLRR